MADKFDIDFFSGNDVELHFTIADADLGGVKDLTGALEVIWILGKSAGKQTLLVKDLTDGIAIDAPPTNGKFTVTLVPADTEGIKGAAYYHECRVTDAAGKKVTVTYGVATVRENSIAT